VRVALAHSRVDKRCSEKEVDEVRVVGQPRGADGDDVQSDVLVPGSRVLDLKCYITPTSHTCDPEKGPNKPNSRVRVTGTTRTWFPREKERVDKEKT
jgi:hypothetical protein